MSFIRGGETITIKRKTLGEVDDFGNPTWVYSNIVVRDALIAVDGSNAPANADRDAVDAKISIYLPPSIVIQNEDVFVIRGSQWVMDGTAQKWVPPFIGLEGGQMIPVRQRRG